MQALLVAAGSPTCSVVTRPRSVRLSKALGTPARHSARRLIAVQAAGHSAAAGGSSKGSKGGGSGRRKKGDPHEMTNVDVDPMTSDPGDLGRVAPGVLEKYEHLDKLHVEHPAGTPSTAPSAAGGSSRGAEPAAAGAEAAQPAPPGCGLEQEMSEMLATDSPGAVEAQHPGETSPAAMGEEAGVQDVE